MWALGYRYLSTVVVFVTMDSAEIHCHEPSRPCYVAAWHRSRRWPQTRRGRWSTAGRLPECFRISSVNCVSMKAVYSMLG